MIEGADYQRLHNATPRALLIGLGLCSCAWIIANILFSYASNLAGNVAALITSTLMIVECSAAGLYCFTKAAAQLVQTGNNNDSCRNFVLSMILSSLAGVVAFGGGGFASTIFRNSMRNNFDNPVDKLYTNVGRGVGVGTIIGVAALPSMTLTAVIIGNGCIVRGRSLCARSEVPVPIMAEPLMARRQSFSSESTSSMYTPRGV